MEDSEPGPSAFSGAAHGRSVRFLRRLVGQTIDSADAAGNGGGSVSPQQPFSTAAYTYTQHVPSLGYFRTMPCTA